jgi:hypothetical protein
VADRVTFAGQVSDEARFEAYRAADVVVLPSVTSQEAFGMVQIEGHAERPARGEHGAAHGRAVGESGRRRPGWWWRRATRTRCARRWRRWRRRPTCARSGPRRRAHGPLATFTAEQMCDGAYEVYRDAAAAARAGGAGRGHAAGQAGARRGAVRRGLLASAPVWAVIAAAIKLEDGGPVFYPAGALRTERRAVPGVESSAR